MSYNPAQGGFAKYFFSMLDDADRNFQYGLAIKACIEEFIATEKRAPRVLDVGIGTGMLSALCIEHGAAHVTGVDVNPTMTALAKDTLSEVDPSGKKWTVKLVKPGASQLGKAKFDMLVSEILGTLTTSESMYKYIGIYAHHLTTFGGGEVDEDGAGLSERGAARRLRGAALDYSVLFGDVGRQGIRRAARRRTRARAVGGGAHRLVPTNEGGLGLHLPLYGERIGERLAIPRSATTGCSRAARATASSSLRTMAKQERHSRACHLGRLALGLFEWSVEPEGRAPRTLSNSIARCPCATSSRAAPPGAFMTALPEITSDVSGTRCNMSVKANLLNAVTKVRIGTCLLPTSSATEKAPFPVTAAPLLASQVLSPSVWPTTPTPPTPRRRIRHPQAAGLVVAGERIGGNVCDTPLPYVTTAADTQIATTFTARCRRRWATRPRRTAASHRR